MSWPYPLSAKGSVLNPADEPVLAPGVRGYTMRENGWYYIPVVAADTPGQGDVSRFLDGLPRDENIRFSTVLNPILAATLERRGFIKAKAFAKEMGEWFEVYERRRARS